MTILEFKIQIREGVWEEFTRDIEGFESEFLSKIPTIAKASAKRVQASVERNLSVEPPAWHTKQGRFKWSNDAEKNAKARRWWFANMPKDQKKSGGFYKRTGKMRRSWESDIVAVGSGDNRAIQATLENTAPGSSYVYGSIAHDWKQVPSHEKTGWLNAGDSDPISRVIEDFYQTVYEEVDIAAEALDPR